MDELIKDIKAQLELNPKTGEAEAIFREAGLTDQQVEECLNVCKRALEGYYGDEIFLPEHNQYWGVMKE